MRCAIRLSTLLLPVLASAGTVHAQGTWSGREHDSATEAPEEPHAPPGIAPPALTPSQIGPGRAAPLVYVGVEGGWDGPRQGALMETNLEAPVVGPLSFRAGAATNPIDGRARPSFALKVDLLTQGRHGVDGAVYGGYRGQGFNLVPAVEMGIAVGRHFQRLSLLSSLAYGQGLEQGERYGDVRVAGLLRVNRRMNLNVGLDARARFDLERDADEPAGEAGFDGVAGPIVVWGIGRFAISGQTGVGVVSMRTGGPTRVGATSRLGVGASF